MKATTTRKKTVKLGEDIIAEYIPRQPSAVYMGVSPGYLDKLKSEGVIPYFKPSSRLVLFKRSDLDAYMERFKVDPSKLSPHETPQRASRGRFAKKGGRRQ